MYVIFPADELIYMTYGAAVPRFKPRPTLDNLREPSVPFPGNRPYSNTINTNPTIQNPRKSSNDLSYPEQQYLNPITSTTPVLSTSRKNSYNREPSPSNYSISPVAQKTDEFGYPSSTNPLDDLNYTRNRRSSSILLEPPSPTPPSNCSFSGDDINSCDRFSAINIDTSTSTTPKNKRNKTKKLHLHIGRLGRSKHQEQTESTRLRNFTDVHVINPTFTSENLRLRNFDAFFEAGQPIYSVETHRQTPQPSSFDKSKNNYQEPEHRPHSLGFLHKPKSTVKFRSKSAEIMDTVEVPQKEASKNTTHRSLFGWRGARGGSLSPAVDNSMASSVSILRDCIHPNLNETLKSHNNVTLKLVKTVSEFTEQLSQLYGHHGEQLQLLVSTFRKKNSELRKERPSCHSTLFQAWETLLQEIEADSVSASDVATSLSRQVSRPLLERTFHRKVQSKKVFTHRESFDTIIGKTEDKLSKCRMEYKQCYIAHRQNPTQHSLTMYIDSHNSYVQQLHATNAMLEAYHYETIPQLVQELEDIYNDLCTIISDSVLQSADLISSKASDQTKRYDGLSQQCRMVSGQQDLTTFLRILQPQSPPKVPKINFSPPQSQPNETDDCLDYNDQSSIPYRNELVLDRNASLQVRPCIEQLKREAIELDAQIRQLQDSIETLMRTQIRGIENQYYHKTNEIQEELSLKQFDLRAKQLHLAAVKAQKDLFLGKPPPSLPISGTDPVSPRTEHRLSSASTPSMKTKWLKAFRSLKPASGPPPPEKRNGSASTSARVYESENHNLIENTYKKITPCDVCSQVLRGHTHQGLRCRICKTNVHFDCISKLGKCQAKAKLLRRQKSTSEIENRTEIEEEREGPCLLSRQLSTRGDFDLELNDIDQVYRVLKQGLEISNKNFNNEKLSINTNNNHNNGLIPSIITTSVITTSTTTMTTSISATTISTTIKQSQYPEIPIFNIPECPERMPRRSTFKMTAQTIQQQQQQQRLFGVISGGGGGGGGGGGSGGGGVPGGTGGGLTAPHITDLSSSDYRVPMIPGKFYQNQVNGPGTTTDTGTRRRLFAGFRPLSAFARGRLRSAQHRSISLPEKDTVEPTRPFGQPLCLVAEDPITETRPTSPAPPTKKGARKKK